MLVIDIGIPALALFVAPILQPILFLFGFPLIAFINSYVFTGIFEKYMPKKEEEPDRELRPLFSDEDEGQP